MAEARTCQKCGAAMEYRLGQFECPACGRIELAPVKTIEMTQPANPVGVSKHDPGAQYRQAKPAPPESTFRADSSPPRVVGGGDPTASSALDEEKRTYLIVYGGLIVLAALGTLFVGPGVLVPATGGGPEYSDAGATFILAVAVAIGGAIGLALLSYALNGRERFAKVGCIALQGFGVLRSLLVLFSGAGAVITVAAIVQIALNGWLISLLIRDINERYGR